MLIPWRANYFEECVCQTPFNLQWKSNREKKPNKIDSFRLSVFPSQIFDFENMETSSSVSLIWEAVNNFKADRTNLN